VVAAAVGLLLIATAASAFSPPGNRLINPGAEDAALTGWEHTGFSSVAYGSSAAYPPAARPGFTGDGTRLFLAGSTGARLLQTVDVTDLAPAIDAGDQQLAFGADLGAPAGSADTIRLTFQTLDAGGQPVGEPIVVGMPTDADRGGQTRIIPCSGGVTAPAGTRAARVTLDAVGAPGPNRAFADAVYVTSEAVGTPAVGERPAEGPGCRTLEPPVGPGTEPTQPGGGQPDGGSPDAGASGDRLFASKLEVERATMLRSDRELDVLAPITARASGELGVELRAAGRTERFDAEIDPENRRVRFTESIPASQARLGSGILTLTYPGDADTQPQEVRLRAAAGKAGLDANRPRMEEGRLKATGDISSRARGVVRLQLLYEPPGQDTRTLEFKADIDDGRYRFDEELTEAQQRHIADRQGVVHSYTLFTGSFEQRIRGEMQSYQVLPTP
jgi:hypothetical protein